VNEKTETAPMHDNLRDLIGQAISDEIAAGAEQPDWCDSREIDRLAGAVIAVLPAAKASPPVSVKPKDTPESMAESNARYAIDGAIQFGREDRNKPPSEEHRLMEYWLIGQQLRELGKTGWDNRTPLDPTEKSALAAAQQHAQAALSDEQIVLLAKQNLYFEQRGGDCYSMNSPHYYEQEAGIILFTRAILATRQPAPVASTPADAAPAWDADATKRLRSIVDLLGFVRMEIERLKADRSSTAQGDVLSKPMYFGLGDQQAAIKAAQTLGIIGAPLNESGAIDLAHGFMKLRLLDSERDAARLDLLEQMANEPEGILLHDGGDFTGRRGLGLRRIGRTLRQAVDAMAAQQGEKGGSA
jgi:hypothetical protein